MWKKIGMNRGYSEELWVVRRQHRALEPLEYREENAKKPKKISIATLTTVLGRKRNEFL